MIFFVVNVCLFAYFSIRFFRNPLSLVSFFLFCLSLVVGIGISFVEAMDFFYGYKMDVSEMWMVEALYLLSLLCFCSTIGFLRKLIVIPNGFSAKYSRLDHMSTKLLACLSVICVLIYLGSKGFSFGSSGYESRYEEGRGTGYLLLFFPAFLPFFVSCLIQRAGKNVLLPCIFGVFYGIAIYFVLNGYRQILLATVLLIAIFSIWYRFINLPTFWSGIFIIFPLVLVTLSFLRYAGEGNVTFLNATEASLYFIQGDLFPVDAILKTLFFVETYSAPGWNIFFEHFLRLVPRFMYPGKPEILDNAAGFYTLQIIEYSRGVTLSPTSISEGLLVGKYWGVALLSGLSGLFCFLYDYWLRKTTSYLVLCCLISFLYMGFFMVREGFQAGLYRFVVLIAFLFIALFLKTIYAYMSRQRVRAAE